MEWKDTAAANLLRLRESKGIEELQRALKDLFPHVDDRVIWNAMIAPLTKMTLAGVVWYQGESNYHSPELYACTYVH